MQQRNETPLPCCPWCGRRKSVSQAGEGQYWCSHCKRLFDDDPDEGGDYSDRNPAARLEREEWLRQRFARRR